MSVKTGPGSPALLRRLNSALVLRTIRASGPLSRAELARTTRLSKPTVNQVVEDLLAGGLIVESAMYDRPHPPRPGRPSRLLSFRPDLGYVLGIDIGADKILVLAADLNGAVVAANRRRTATQARQGAEALLAELQGAVYDALASGGIPLARLKGAGVGTPGIVDPVSGRVTLAPQITGWQGIQLGKYLEKWLPCPVLVDGEVHLSLLAERQVGAIQRINDAVYIHIGVGIGCGILIGGEIYRGANGAAGEIGYLPLPDGAPTSEEGAGSFEVAAGGEAFARHGRHAAARPGGALLRALAGGNPEAVDAGIVFEAARRNDTVAQAIVDQLIALLARGVASVVVTLNPEVVLIGGGLARAGQDLLAPLAARVRAMVPRPPQFVLSSLGDEAVALGGLQRAIQLVNRDVLAVASG